jgi:6-phosphogluconate dehydrogenase
MKYDIGVIGLAVMGANLARNMESKGFKVAGFSRTESKRRHFEQTYGNANFFIADTLEEMVNALKKPRKVMLMIKAGRPVDMVIDQLKSLLEPGDIIIDGGNSNYEDTIRRTNYVESLGFLFIGTGVSGGEEGALLGPSIMPGGSKEAWPFIEPIFTKIAAVSEDGDICSDWVGKDGAGHFVKMVHNGIEYGDIQLITEVYQMMRDYLGMSNDDIAAVFKSWNESELKSYLIEITAEVLSKKDDDGLPMVDKILDVAGQKGTGKWTSISALKEGIPLSLITEAVLSRFLSSQKNERVKANGLYQHQVKKFKGDKSAFISDLKYALYIAKIISYAQGFSLLKQASQTYDWDLNYSSIAKLWKAGCIIRSVFLDKIAMAYQNNHQLNNLLMAEYFKKEISDRESSLREVVSHAVLNGVPTPALSSSLAYLDGYRTKRLPANLLQGLRDYFGAHTYERVDKDRGEFFHTNWTGQGGDITSTTYNNKG